MIGTVEFYNNDLRYGIIKLDDKDMICTARDIILVQGDRVSFNIIRKETGLEAINIERMI